MTMISDEVADVLYVIGRWLAINEPESTFADLLKAYFKYVTGVDYGDVLDNVPDDEKVIELHLESRSITDIAEILADDNNYVRIVLLSYGFSPGKKVGNALAMEHLKYERMVRDGLLEQSNR